MVLWLLGEQFMPLEELVSKILKLVLQTFVQKYYLSIILCVYNFFILFCHHSR
jgi:hypothetical protein